MKTTVSNWYIVTVMSEGELIGEVLWGLSLMTLHVDFPEKTTFAHHRYLRFILMSKSLKLPQAVAIKHLGKAKKR